MHIVFRLFLYGHLSHQSFGYLGIFIFSRMNAERHVFAWGYEDAGDKLPL